MFKRGDKLEYIGSDTIGSYIKGNIYTVFHVYNELRFEVVLPKGPDQWNFTAHGVELISKYWKKVSGAKQKNLPEWW